MSLFVSAETLRIWAKKLEARSILPHLVRRLVQATGIGITELNFPAYESVQRPGFDGLVSCTVGILGCPLAEACGS